MPPTLTTEAPTELARSEESPRAAAQSHELTRVRFRRAVTLMLMTILLPGSAQLVMGNKAVGRVAVRLWLGMWALVGVMVLLSFADRSVAIKMGANPAVLGFVRFGLAIAAIGWAALLIDAWRLGEPLGLKQRQRLAVVGVNGVLVFVVAGSLLFASHLVAVQRGFISAVFGDGVASSAQAGRYNVLLIGGDAGSDRWGLRTDSLTVASIDEETGRTILFGLPRNMTNFPFPEGSILSKAFPNGYDCDTCELNSLATWAGDHRDLFAGVEQPAIDATIEGVEGITGLKINYYAMVNMQGFRSLVTAMGGLKLNVRDDIPIGGGAQGQIGTIEKGIRTLNGYEVLWFARSRMAADDYSRMARQKCVMSAMVTQLSPRTVLTKFDALTQASANVLETNVPASELDTFVDLALKARTQKISSVSFVPPAIVTANPDIDKIRTMIDNAIAKSNSGPSAGEAPKKKGTGFAANRQDSTTGGSIGSLSEGYDANSAGNLAKAC